MTTAVDHLASALGVLVAVAIAFVSITELYVLVRLEDNQASCVGCIEAGADLGGGFVASATASSVIVGHGAEADCSSLVLRFLAVALCEGFAGAERSHDTSDSGLEEGCYKSSNNDERAHSLYKNYSIVIKM